MSAMMQVYEVRIILLFLFCVLFPTFSSVTVMRDDVYHVFKQFIDPINSYDIKRLEGGFTDNIQYLCTVNEKKYVVRLPYQPYFERKNEIMMHIYFADKGIAPRLYHYTDDYSCMIMDFIEGHTLTFEDARKEPILKKMADALNCIQQESMNFIVSYEKGNNKNIREYVLSWYNTIKKDNPHLPVSIDNAFNACEYLYESLDNESWPLVLNHNDIHPRNLFLVQDTCIIIDWEIAGPNYSFYDLSNYSIYACLDNEQEYYFLNQYLKREPSLLEWNYFKKTKLLSMLVNIFGWLEFLGPIPDDIGAIKDFSYYAAIFAQNRRIDDPHFFFELSLSLVEKFSREYELFFRVHSSLQEQ